MKHLICSFLSFILIVNCLVAQDPPRRDTIWGDWPNQPYYNDILQAPVVTGETQEIIILPNRQVFCYDKQIQVKMQVGSSAVEQCLYLNTTEGHVGYCPPYRSGSGNVCDINPNDKDFSFFIIGMKGNIYKYNNTEKNGNIQHWVSTGNSQTYLYRGPAGSGGDSAVLHKKSETRMYCNNKIKGKAYKFDGSSTVWYLFGQDYPEKLIWKKYMGNFGIGYLSTNHGLYMLMEMEDGRGNSYKVTSAEKVNTCFDPQPFHMMEDELYTKRRAELDREQIKIDQDEAAAQRSGECVSEQMAAIGFRREQLQKQSENLEQSRIGNMYQDKPTQNAMIGMMDQTSVVQQSILSTKVSICKTQKAMDETTSASSRAHYQERLSCLQESVTSLQTLLSQMQALDVQYADNPGMRMAEKSRLYMRNLPRGCN
jgi:hypothetical protein